MRVVFMNWTMKCVAKLFVGLIVFVLSVSGMSLYSPNDGVVLLENDTISLAIYNSPVAWFVEFYSSWCGHCQSFAPSWKRLAKQVEGWTNVIRVAAIDCAEARNLKTCANFSIQGYPSLKFFKAFTHNTSDIGIFYPGKRSPRKMRHAMINFLETKQHFAVQHVFNPVDSKLSDQFYKKKFKSKHLALVFEKNTSYLGKELSLDLMNNPKISVKRVTNDKYRKKKYRVTRLPHVVLLHNNEKIHLTSQTREEILAELEKFHVGQKKAPTPKVIEVTNRHFKEVHKNDTMNIYQTDMSVVHMQDLEGALSSIFLQELVIKKTFDDVRQKALNNFVDLLVQCFPGRPPIMNFLKLFRTWLQGRNSASPVTPQSLNKFYQKHQGDPTLQLPVEILWRTCQGRGYPCSLWLLFHTLTVNCEHRKTTKLSGADVLARIRGYVKNFFGCIECGKHFYAMSKNVENEVSSFDEGILWLWNAHNKVNKRLSKEPSTNPNYPKIQYPPKELCEDCSKFDKDPTLYWRKDVVLQFLKVHYGLNNIRLVKEQNEVASDEKDISESAFADVYMRNVIPRIKSTIISTGTTSAKTISTGNLSTGTKTTRTIPTGTKTGISTGSTTTRTISTGNLPTGTKTTRTIPTGTKTGISTGSTTTRTISTGTETTRTISTGRLSTSTRTGTVLTSKRQRDKHYGLNNYLVTLTDRNKEHFLQMDKKS